MNIETNILDEVKLQVPTVSFDGIEPSELPLVRQAIDYYHLCLKCSLPAKKLAKQAGVASEKAFTKFELGYVNRTLGLNLPDARSFEGASQRGLYQRIGLFNVTGHEVFRWALLFPLYDIDGNIVGAYGYWVRKRTNSNDARLVIWNDSDVGVFNPEVITSQSKLLVCSTPLVVCQLWCEGFKSAVSLMAKNEITFEHVKSIFEGSDVKEVQLLDSGDLIEKHQILQLDVYLKSLGIKSSVIKQPKRVYHG